MKLKEYFSNLKDALGFIWAFEDSGEAYLDNVCKDGFPFTDHKEISNLILRFPEESLGKLADEIEDKYTI